MKIVELSNAPRWLTAAHVENEDVVIEDGCVIWRSGTWRDGTWRDGTIGRHASSTAPLTISGLKWPVLYGSRALTIGCQSHTYEDWSAMTPEAITAMHPSAGAWWQTWKTRILALRPIQEGIR